jgi:hypothetical protein
MEVFTDLDETILESLESEVSSLDSAMSYSNRKIADLAERIALLEANPGIESTPGSPNGIPSLRGL